MILIVARHCQTILNKHNRIQGAKSDHELTEYGQMQAVALKAEIYKTINNHAIDKVYSSKTKRTKQTIDIVTPQIKVLYDDRLKAYNVGSAEGKRPSEIFHIMRYPVPVINSGMESLRGFINRTKDALADILLNLNKNEVSLIVTHEDVSAMIEKYIMKKSYISVPRLGLENGEFRIYNILNMDKQQIAKGNFSSLEVVKHECAIDGRKLRAQQKSMQHRL